MIKLAVDSGNVKSMKAEIVRQKDNYIYKGYDKDPEFNCDAFSTERGDIVGVFAKAVMTDGSFIVENMRIDEIEKIRNDSKAYASAVKAGGRKLENNIWVKYFEEMAKKTVLKRLFKTLPPATGYDQLMKAVDVVNEHEGSNFDNEIKDITPQYTDDQSDEYKRCIQDDDFFNLVTLNRSLDIDSQLALHGLHVPTPAQGQKTKFKQNFKRKLDEADKQLEMTVEYLRERLINNDDSGAHELVSDCSTFTYDWICSQLSGEHQMQLNQISEAS